MNPEKAAIQILIVSLISSILHALISVIKFLSTSKTNRINDQVMINEIGANLKINKENLESKFGD